MNRAAIGRDVGLWLLELAHARSFCWQKWALVVGGMASVGTVVAVSASAVHGVFGNEALPTIANETARRVPDESASQRAREELANQGHLAPSTVQALCADDDPAAQRTCSLLSMGGTSSDKAVQKSVALDGPVLHVRLDSLWPQVRQEVLAWQRGQGESLATIGADAVSSKMDRVVEASARSITTPPRMRGAKAGMRRARASAAGLRFVEKGNDHLHLILAAGASFQGQVVASNGGQEIRVIAPLRAETRSWLSQRPRMRDVEVTHVRSGEQAVVVGLRVDPSWQVERLQPTAQGAVLSFRATK